MVLPVRRLATQLDWLQHEYKVGARFMPREFSTAGSHPYRRR